MEKKKLAFFALHTHYFICLLIKSARVMSFTIFDNVVVVVTIAARKVLLVFLVFAVINHLTFFCVCHIF